MVSGFPVSVLKKVEATLEQKKINYLILDRKDNYSINYSMNFKNLNAYEKIYNASKLYINNIKRIDSISEYLTKNASFDLLELAYEANTTSNDELRITTTIVFAP